MQSSEQLVDRFKAFCEAAGPALECSQPKPPIQEFRSFVEAARPLLLETIRDQLGVIQEALQCLRPWLLEDRFDLLRVARLTGAEDPYTELLAWAIDPATDSAIGAACQRDWLASLGITEAMGLGAARPMTQFATDDGIPDMVLNYPDLLVVVEAKTGTAEHATPLSGEMQTHSYPAAVRRRIGRPSDFSTTTVFLTLDGSEATNGEAIRPQRCKKTQPFTTSW